VPKIPSYCRHHGKFARVKIDGRWIHLGLYNSEDSKAHFKRLVAGLLAVSPVTQQHDTVTVAEVLEAYRAWAERHYGDVPHGQYRNLLTTPGQIALEIAFRDGIPVKMGEIVEAWSAIEPKTLA